jgi:hypothetical protein
MIGPGGLLLVLPRLFTIPVSVMWVEHSPVLQKTLHKYSSVSGRTFTERKNSRNGSGLVLVIY